MHKAYKAAAVLLFLPATAFAQISNGGFESGGLTPWFNANNFCGSACEAWNVTTADSHTGLYSATNRGNMEIRQNFSPILTSTITSFNFWMRRPEGGIAFAALYYNDASDGGALVTNTGAWGFYDMMPFLTAGAHLTGFSLYGCDGCSGESRVYLDDVMLRSTGVVPEPASIVLMASGLIGVFGAAARRRKS